MALIAGLVLLTAVSLLAVSAARSMGLTRLQAANLKDNALALENARHAEAWAKAWLFSRADIEREAGCSTSCLLPPAVNGAGFLPDDVALSGAAWWRTNGFEAGAHPESGASLMSPPTDPETSSWVMEEIHVEPTGMTAAAGAAAVAYYRILARGRGKNPASIAVTETLVARPWEGNFEAGLYPPQAGSPHFCDQFSLALTCGTVAWRRLR